MAFSWLAARRSMRAGPRCMAAAGNRLYRWGLKNVDRSMFVDVDDSRSAGLFSRFVRRNVRPVQAHRANHKFHFKSKLFSMDAVTIKLCLSLFP